MNNMKNKKILITGADGFIGSHLTEKLALMGCDVRAMCLYNSFNSWGWLDSIDKKLLKKIEVVLGDVRDIKSVTKACKNVDYVFHLASLIAIPHSYNSPYSYLRTNAEGTMNILEACIDTKVQKIVHTSTSEVYGDIRKMPISETDKIFAKSPYSATKIAADQIAASYYSSFGLPVTTVRPFNTYGPRQSNRAIIPTIITQILDGKKQIKLGSLYPTRDFSYIDDTVNGFVAAAVSNKSTGETFNIGTGYEISVGELFEVINKLCDSNSKIKTENIRVRPKSSEVHRLKADNRKAKKIINWKPLYSGKSGLIRGLKSTIEWFSEETNLKKYKTDHYIT